MDDLTDLIAAHQIQLFGVDGPHYQAETEYDGCLCGWQGAEEDHPAHVALVVEQHTNGRIAIAAVAIADARRWEARAEKAEDTIARVIEGAQMLVESFQRVERGGNHLYDASTHRCADNLALLLAEAQGPEHLRAALEGES